MVSKKRLSSAFSKGAGKVKKSAVKSITKSGKNIASKKTKKQVIVELPTTLSSKLPLIIGNWKSYIESEEQAEIVSRGIASGMKDLKGLCSVAITPSLLHVPIVRTTLVSVHKKNTSLGNKSMLVTVGAQDISAYAPGAQTGLVSAQAVKASGQAFTLIGHSEVRTRGEDSETLTTKVKLALAAGLSVVYCFGERVRDEEGTHFKDIAEQLQTLSTVSLVTTGRVVLAYEPVWAIGTGKSIVPHDLHEMILYVRKHCATQASLKIFADAPIIYGGSVSPDNAGDFISAGKADGLLVGKQSIDPQAFVSVVNKAREAFKKR
jgi:triosephosphate isomerase (TIM)